MRTFKRRSVLRNFALQTGTLVFSGALATHGTAGEVIQLSTIETAATSRGVVFFGTENSGDAGEAIAGAGDVNNDGIADFLIGAKDANNFSVVPDLSDTGETYLVFGGASFASNILLQDVSDGTQPNTASFLGIEEFDSSAFDVSGLGDFNGDGIDDFAIGVHRADGALGTENKAGETYVVFGKSSGLGSVDLTNFAAGTSSDGLTFFGADAEDEAGVQAKGIGDFNGDGLNDLLIGANYGYGSSDSGGGYGEVYVVFGRSATGSFDLSTIENGSPSDGIAIFGEAPGDELGDAVAWAGDVNGDGFDDIIMGVDYSPFVTTYGEAIILFGEASPSGNLELGDIRSGSVSNAVVFSGADEYDGFGYSVSSAGDVNGDGFADVVIGALNSYGITNSRPYSGESFIVFGEASLPSSLDMADVISGSSTAIDGFILFGADAGDFSGTAVSGAGDVNGDGFSDVLSGADFSDGQSDSAAYAGEAYLLFGSNATGVTQIDLVEFEDGTTTRGLTIFGADADDEAGDSLSGVGDVTGDGLADYIIGVSEGHGSGDVYDDSGEAYLIFGANPAASGTYRRHIAPGDANNVGIAIDPNTTIPASRVWIDFDAGDNGTGGASLQTVTITRSNSGLSGGVDSSNAANVAWEISTDRTGWTNAELVFKYTDAEISGLTEAHLVLYKAASASGPWTELTTTVDTDKNTLTTSVSSFSWFAISDQSGLPVTLDSFGVE